MLRKCLLYNKKCFGNFVILRRHYCNLKSKKNISSNEINIQGATYETDEWTNVTSKILSLVGRNLHQQKKHPLNLVHDRIINYFYGAFKNSRGNPQFSVYSQLKPVVTIQQNFDSLLIPEDHPSRTKSDCYYINKEHLLRAHTTAHQAELIRSGLNDFLVAGDVYRRDEVDSTHYPVFHQVDGVRLRTRDQLFPNSDHQLFNAGMTQVAERQACHTCHAVEVMEAELKTSLEGLARSMFGDTVKMRWVQTQFPFTEPSWELEVLLPQTDNKDESWLEVLGCGIMRQEILHAAGVQDRIGWAFGLGLERLAMCLYRIPDIRLFWSADSGFLSQFNSISCEDKIIYQPVSQYPQCSNDLSFWLPDSTKLIFSSNDFYDLVRSIGGDVVEQVRLVDEWRHPRTQRISHCYRITYRHMERTLTQNEVNDIHQRIAQAAQQQLHISIR